jgi:hypothetical protein
MYFPGQGALLALGMLMGHAWIGVLVSSAVFCGAVVWALQAWMPRRFALLAGILALLRFGTISYWVNSYWGGAVAALGGCLVVGAFGRIRRRASITQGLVLGAGLVLIASTRPVEGLVFASCVGLSCVILLVKAAIRSSLVAALAASIIVAGAGVGWIGYHSYRVNGDPLTPPYLVNRQQYGWPMALPWQKVIDVNHNHARLLRYQNWEKEQLARKSTLSAFVINYSSALVMLWTFFVGPALTIPLLWAYPWRLKGKLFPLYLWGGATFLFGSLEFGLPHYFAPATVCFLAMIVQALRKVRVWNRHTHSGLAKYRSVIGCFAAVAVVAWLKPPDVAPRTFSYPAFLSWCCHANIGHHRADVAKWIGNIPGKHVVFVSHSPDGPNLEEWVYNDASVDSSRIVWVRDMGEERNVEVLQYYRDRSFWQVNPDMWPSQAQPYRIGTTGP